MYHKKKLDTTVVFLPYMRGIDTGEDVVQK